MLFFSLGNATDNRCDVLHQAQGDRSAMIGAQITDDSSASHFGILAADLFGKEWSGGKDDTGALFQGAERGAALRGLVDVTVPHRPAVWCFISFLLLVFSCVTTLTDVARRTIRFILLYRFRRSPT